MVANGARTYDSNDAIVAQGIGRGEIAVGLVNHYYVLEIKAQFPDLPGAIHYFPKGDLGSLINVAGAGVVNTSKQPGLAQRLILYLLASGAQKYFADTTFEYPLATGVAPHASLKPLAEIEAPQIDLSKLADLKGTLDLLRETKALP
jgi:iron(III) transport system substrate-binding protein